MTPYVLNKISLIKERLPKNKIRLKLRKFKLFLSELFTKSADPISALGLSASYLAPSGVLTLPLPQMFFDLRAKTEYYARSDPLVSKLFHWVLLKNSKCLSKKKLGQEYFLATISWHEDRK